MSARNASSLDESGDGRFEGDLGAFDADAAAPSLAAAKGGDCAFNSSHWRASEETAEALIGGRSVAMIVGEPESGLAATAAEAARTLDRRFSPIRISARGATGLRLAQLLAEALGVSPEEEEDGSILDALRTRLEQLAGLDVAVAAFISDAEALDEDGLAIIGRLAAHGRRLARTRAIEETGGAAPLGLKAVLVGRPCLVERLKAQKDGAMRQAADAAARLRNFQPDEVRAYLRRRLRAESGVEIGGAGPITAEAVERAARVTGGRPERLGALCAHPALEQTVAAGELVDGALIRRIAADLDFDELEPAPEIQGAPEDQTAQETDEAFEDPMEEALEDAAETAELEAWATLERDAERSRRLAEELSRQLGGAAGSDRLSLANRRLSERIAKVAGDAARKLRHRVAARLARRRPAVKARHRTVTRGAWARWLMMGGTAIAVGMGLAVISVLGPKLLAPQRPAPSGVGAPELASDGPGRIDGSGPVLDIVDSALGAAESAVRVVVGDAKVAEEVASTRADLARGRALKDLEGLTVEERAAEIERRVDSALALAEQRYQAERFTAPQGESAYDALLKAYYLDPADARVAAGFDKLVGHYRAEAQSALAREQFPDFYRLNALVEAIQRRRPL